MNASAVQLNQPDFAATVRDAIKRHHPVAKCMRAGEHAVTELGWALARAHWGQGLATEAARAVREWTYAERGVERLISLIDPKNTRSVRVADKLGAVPDELVTTVYGPLLVWLHPR